MPLYMKWGAGPDIKGEVSESAHKDWLAIDSASFGVGRSTNFQVGSGQEKRHRDQPTVVLSYYLRDCLISSYSVGGGGGGASESLALNFTGINIEYTPYDADDAPQTAKKGAFDLVTAKQT